MTEKCCDECKHFKPVITEQADYYCYNKQEYRDYPDIACDDFEQDTKTLKEKEDKVW